MGIFGYLTFSGLWCLAGGRHGLSGMVPGGLGCHQSIDLLVQARSDSAGSFFG